MGLHGHDRRSPIVNNGPKYLRWALIEAPTHGVHHDAYKEHYQQAKACLGRQRCVKLVRVEVARGSIAYSAVTHPLPCPRSHGGGFSSSEAAQSTCVSPKRTRQEPSA